MNAPTPAEALRALSLIHRQPVMLVSIRASGSALMVTVRRPDGALQPMRISSVDAPGLELLQDTDRARVRSALSVLSRPEPPRAA